MKSHAKTIPRRLPLEFEAFNGAECPTDFEGRNRLQSLGSSEALAADATFVDARGRCTETIGLPSKPCLGNAPGPCPRMGLTPISPPQVKCEDLLRPVASANQNRCSRPRSRGLSLRRFRRTSHRRRLAVSRARAASAPRHARRSCSDATIKSRTTKPICGGRSSTLCGPSSSNRTTRRPMRASREPHSSSWPGVYERRRGDAYCRGKGDRARTAELRSNDHAGWDVRIVTTGSASSRASRGNGSHRRFSRAASFLRENDSPTFSRNACARRQRCSSSLSRSA